MEEGNEGMNELTTFVERGILLFFDELAPTYTHLHIHYDQSTFYAKVAMIIFSAQ